MNTATQATSQDIQRFCQMMTDRANESYAQRGDNVNRARFEPSPGGKKYVRIVHISIIHGHEPGGGSAHCFVKIEDGTLWKPDGWKGPAKNFPRGSVFDVPEHENTGR